MDSQTIEHLQNQGRLVRSWALKAITAAASGHPGGSLSCTDLIVALYFNFLKHDPANPAWEERDRFILSKGHAAPALYAALGLAGYYPVEEIMTLRQLGSPFQGHPDRRFMPILEASTGSLGQGLSMGIGMALAARLKDHKHHVFVLLGDGECDEGQIWEGAMFAGFHNLANMTVIVDANGFQLDDSTHAILDLEPFQAKWEANGFTSIAIDGHDYTQILPALERAKKDDAPTVIIAKTIKGKGVSFIEGNNAYHGKALTPEQLGEALKELGGGNE